MKSAIEPARGVDDRDLSNAFAAGSSKSLRAPMSCRSSSTGESIEARRGGTLLGAAMKNGIRLMHVCGARTLCATCRVVVESGEDNLTPMRANRKILAPLASIDESADAAGVSGARQRAGRGRSGVSAMRRFAEQIEEIAMSWPLKLRAMSFAVTMGVTLTESVMGAMPIGLALWFFGVASGRTSNFVAVVAATVSLSISIYSHVRPRHFSSHQKRGAV